MQGLCVHFNSSQVVIPKSLVAWIWNCIKRQLLIYFYNDKKAFKGYSIIFSLYFCGYHQITRSNSSSVVQMQGIAIQNDLQRGQSNSATQLEFSVQTGHYTHMCRQVGDSKHEKPLDYTNSTTNYATLELFTEILIALYANNNVACTWNI